MSKPLQMPLIERLLSVPRDAQYSRDVGPFETQYWGVGAMCHEAADALAKRSARADLLSTLEDALEYIEEDADVKDGSDGRPVANRAMSLAQSIREVLRRVA